MTGIESLIAVADAYGAACSVSEKTVSKRALQDSSRLGELRSGTCDIGVRRLARTLQWFSDNWPTGSDEFWPSEVIRPGKAGAIEGAVILAPQREQAVA